MDGTNGRGDSPRPVLRPKERFAILARDGFRCRYCGAAPPDVALTVDHVRPQRGGRTVDNRPDNLLTACERCNNGKHDDRYEPLTLVRLRQEVAGHLHDWMIAGWGAALDGLLGWDVDEETCLLLLLHARNPIAARNHLIASAIALLDADGNPTADASHPVDVCNTMRRDVGAPEYDPSTGR